MSRLDELSDILGRHSARGNGAMPTAIPRLGLYRANEPSAPTPNVYDSMFCLVVAGRKQVFVGQESLEYGAGEAFLVTVDLPVVGTVLQASPSRPYLAMGLELDRSVLASVVLQTENAIGKDRDEGGLRVARASDEVLDAALRLARLLDQPSDASVLAPLVERELLYRLLTGPWGAVLRDIARADSRVFQVSRAVAWLRENFTKDYDAQTLAASVGMSVPSLNRHFRVTTAMSPLEYQKRIRLQEARRLLYARETDIASVGYAVGYRSVSQFTREYRRLFEESPGRDADRLRESIGAGGSP